MATLEQMKEDVNYWTMEVYRSSQAEKINQIKKDLEGLNFVTNELIKYLEDRKKWN